MVSNAKHLISVKTVDRDLTTIYVNDYPVVTMEDRLTVTVDNMIDIINNALINVLSR